MGSTLRRTSKGLHSVTERFWVKALEKVAFEGACRYCGARPFEAPLDPAHTIGRAEQDKSMDRGIVEEGEQATGEHSKVLFVDPISVVPLCRDCHDLYDGHALDIRWILYEPEFLHAVEIAGSEAALQRLEPLASRKDYDAERGTIL